jgi:hypothetical protein
MQICLVDAAEGKKIQLSGYVPDCHFHQHISERDAHQADADGKVRFVSPRAVVAVDSFPLCGYWYDAAVNRNDRYQGTAQSGGFATKQLVNFMPRGTKHKVRDIAAHGAHGRLMTAKAVNVQSPITKSLADQELEDAQLG